MKRVHQSDGSDRIHQPLDRHHSQLLLALHDSGRLARAAELLSITPSAASHRLREAERRVGVTLAVPDGRSLRLTASGRHLAEAAALVEAALQSAEDTARWIGAGVAPRVRLALDFYDTLPWFDELVADPRDRDDDADDDERVGVSVVRVGYESGRDAVERRSADIATELAPGDRDLTDPLADDELAAVVPPDHPAAGRGALTVDDVVRATYLTAGSTPRSGFEHERFMAPAGAFARALVRVESVALILRLVAAGRGITVQPRLALGPAEQHGLAVIPLDGVTIPVRWGLVTRPEHDPVTARVVERLRRCVEGTGAGWARPVTGR